jgi:acetolactate synthase-1/2/3 large subunit
VAPRGRPLDAASPPSLRRAAELLTAARRPVAVIGSSAMRLGNPSLLQALIDRHRLPFASTTMAKGMIAEDHRLSLGCIERARRQVQRELLRSADLVVGLGYDVVEVEYEAWIGQVPLLSIDIEPVDADQSVRVAHQVVGDLDASLEWLAGLPALRPEWPAEMPVQHRDRFQRSLRPPVSGFAPHHAIDVVRELLPRDGVLAFDVGAHTHQIASQWTAHEPRTFLITNGRSPMGFGLPAAIAAKLARPERAAVALIGDGCFQMTVGELAAARRLGLSLPIVVLDDGWLSLIQVKQVRRHFGLYGTDLGEHERIDPPAHYFGVPAIGARSADGLRQALKDALAANHPTVIEATVDPSHYLDTVYD